MENLKIINNSEESVYIRLFKVNMLQEIKANDYLLITIENDDVKEYYENVASELGLEVESEEPTPTIEPYDRTIEYKISDGSEEITIFTYRLTVTKEIMEQGYVGRDKGVYQKWSAAPQVWGNDNFVSCTIFDTYCSNTSVSAPGNKIEITVGPGAGAEGDVYDLTEITKANLDVYMDNVERSIETFAYEDYSNTLQEFDAQENLLYEMTATADKSIYSIGEGDLSCVVHNNTDKVLANDDPFSSFELPAGQTTNTGFHVQNVHTYVELNNKVMEAFSNFYLKGE